MSVATCLLYTSLHFRLDGTVYRIPGFILNPYGRIGVKGGENVVHGEGVVGIAAVHLVMYHKAHCIVLAVSVRVLRDEGCLLYTSCM